MKNIVTKSEIETLLHRWQSGEITHQQVFDWASDRYFAEHWLPEDEIANAVLAELDTMDMNLTTTDDIPYLLSLLAISKNQSEEVHSIQ